MQDSKRRGGTKTHILKTPAAMAHRRQKRIITGLTITLQYIRSKPSKAIAMHETIRRRGKGYKNHFGMEI